MFISFIFLFLSLLFFCGNLIKQLNSDGSHLISYVIVVGIGKCCDVKCYVNCVCDFLLQEALYSLIQRECGPLFI